MASENDGVNETATGKFNHRHDLDATSTEAAGVDDNAALAVTLYDQVAVARNVSLETIDITPPFGINAFATLLETIRRSKVLKELAISGFFFTNEKFYDLVRAISTNNTVETLRMNSRGYVPVEPLCSLLLDSNATVRLKRIKCILEPSSSEIATIFESLARNQFLSHVWIEIVRGSPVFCWNDWETILLSLKRNSALVELIVHCGGCSCMGKSEFKTLLQGLDSCPTLRSFSCTRKSYPCQDDFLAETALKRLRRRNQCVTKLDPSLVMMKNDRQVIFEAITESNIRRKLDLDVSMRSLNEKETLALIQALPNMKIIIGIHGRPYWKLKKEFLCALEQNRSLEFMSWAESRLPRGIDPSQSQRRGRIFWCKIKTWPYREIQFYLYRNRFWNCLEEESAALLCNEPAESPQLLLPPRNLWPHILFLMDQETADGASLVFWALQSYSFSVGLISPKISSKDKAFPVAERCHLNLE